MALPQWVTDALNAITQVPTNASRTVKLGYGGAVQGIANQLGYTAPTPEQDAMFPADPRAGGTPPPLRHDIAGEQFRNQMQSELSPAAAAFVGQVPVGNVWDDVAPIQYKQWNGGLNYAVAPQYTWMSGHKNTGGMFPMQAAYFGRHAPTPGSPGNPEQGHWIHHGGGENVNDGNQGGWDEWIVDQPATSPIPAGPNPSQVAIPMDSKHQFGTKVALYRTIENAMGDINTQQFDADLGTYIQQNPQIANDLLFLNTPFYTGMSGPQKLRVAWAVLAAKYGEGLKNTPIGNHYTGVLK